MRRFKVAIYLRSHKSCERPALTRLHNNINGWRADDLDNRSLVKKCVDIPWVWLRKCSREASHALHKSTRGDVLQALAKGLRTSDNLLVSHGLVRSGTIPVTVTYDRPWLHHYAPNSTKKDRKEKSEALWRMREREKWETVSRKGRREEKDSWFSVLWLWHWGPH